MNQNQDTPPIAGWVAWMIATIETLGYEWQMSNWHFFAENAAEGEICP